MNLDYGAWLPPDYSPQGVGTLIDLLINALHVFMLALFVGWGIYMIYCLVIFRSRPGHQAQYRPVKATITKVIEIGVVVLEVVLLVGLSIPAWTRLKIDPTKLDPPVKAEDMTTIRVVAQQFAWNVHYPGPDGEFGRTDPSHVDETENPMGIDPDDPASADDIKLLNTLHIPKGKWVLVELMARDVIHSFAIPVLRVKQDAIPGMMVKVWFQSTEATATEDEYLKWFIDANPDKGPAPPRFEIACAQLCGIGHSTMRGSVYVHEQADYDAWLETQAAGEEFSEEEEFVE